MITKLIYLVILINIVLYTDAAIPMNAARDITFTDGDPTTGKFY